MAMRESPAAPGSPKFNGLLKELCWRYSLVCLFPGELAFDDLYYELENDPYRYDIESMDFTISSFLASDNMLSFPCKKT